MQNSMVMFTFSVSRFRFLGKFGPKNQSCQFKLKFGAKTNLNMQSSVVVFTFAVLDRKHPFWENFNQKISVSLSEV